VLRHEQDVATKREGKARAYRPVLDKSKPQTDLASLHYEPIEPED
jgi:hypothetical protein